ncbi:MAG TPA: glycosyltransferase family 2 protein [Polyangiales bacterium]|nr:glycosyltransferase family 2 protein [Polyangiales bacterium]
MTFGLRESARPAPVPNVLSVVIPALNEEDAIGDTLKRCLEARESMIASHVVSDMEVLVVSDGSTDRTEEIARSFPQVTVLSFELNRGYGAAIKCGFEHTRGELIAFLDADGTCDPAFFAVLIEALRDGSADVALGSRMGEDSKMPLIRTIGNRLFAWLLSLVSFRTVNDTASGMRVIRREALRHLYPLPDGMHFTPAMSARALLEGRLKLVEAPMPYAERTGRSKLRVLRDGLNFLGIIVRAAVIFHPARPLLILASICAVLGLLLAAHPLVFYAQYLQLEEWVIYRVLLSSLFFTTSVLVTCAAAIADRIAALAHGRSEKPTEAPRLQQFFTPLIRGTVQAGLVVAAFLVITPGIHEYLMTSHVTMHWSRAVLGSLLFLTAVMFSITGFLLRMIDYIVLSRDNRSGVQAPDRVRAAH